jgi:threonine/homoserine/homoserine lactone efflux protein
MDGSLLVAAALIGLSFQNSFTCVLLTFSASAGQGFRAGIGFVAGRLLGVLILGSVFALIGSMIEIDTRSMLYLFGGITVVLGGLLLWNPPFLSKIGLGPGCRGGPCRDCDDSAVELKAHDCRECPSKDGCGEKRPPSRWGDLGFFSVGLVRGATPCLKVMLLVPLLVTLPFLQGAAITATYALTSSIYPIVGIALASMLSDLTPKRIGPYLSRAGALAMIGVGLYFIYKAYNYACAGT